MAIARNIPQTTDHDKAYVIGKSSSSRDQAHISFAMQRNIAKNPNQRMKDQVTEEIPYLLSTVASEDASHIFEFQTISDNVIEAESKDLPIEWTISVQFSRKFNERQLWAAFHSMFEAQDRQFPGTVFAVGLIEGTQEEISLFTNALYDEEKPKKGTNSLGYIN